MNYCRIVKAIEPCDEYPRGEIETTCAITKDFQNCKYSRMIGDTCLFYYVGYDGCRCSDAIMDKLPLNIKTWLKLDDI